MKRCSLTQVVKEDISIEEEEEDWGLESGAGSEVGDVGEHSQSDLLPPHSCTNSSLASSIDPALVSKWIFAR